MARRTRLRYALAMAGRPLTPGEVELVRSVFGNSIEIRIVRLVLGKWYPFHPRRTAMAPTGHIWFHPDGGGWSEDYSIEPLQLQAFFIHEMTHVLQAQRNGKFYLPLVRHPFCRYGYKLKSGKPFGRYGVEQQAEIVRHVFLQRRGHHPVGAAPLEALEQLIKAAGFHEGA